MRPIEGTELRPGVALNFRSGCPVFWQEDRGQHSVITAWGVYSSIVCQVVRASRNCDSELLRISARGRPGTEAQGRTPIAARGSQELLPRLSRIFNPGDRKYCTGRFLENGKR